MEKIDPIDELLKAIEIVHGKSYANTISYLIWRWREYHKWDCVEWD
jgi:hypothetical protein